MALGVYEVVWVACQSHSWFVLYVSGETTRQTSDANDYVDAKSPCAEVHGEGADKGEGRGESIFFLRSSSLSPTLTHQPHLESYFDSPGSVSLNRPNRTAKYFAGH